MTRGKLALSVLSAIACLAVAMPAAHAGGGMGAGSASLSIPVSCRVILNAPNDSRAINISDFFNSPGGDAVKVGAAVLYCQPASAALISGGSTPAVTAPDSMTCYNLGNADQAKDSVTFTDPFGTQKVTTGGISVFCVPSHTDAFQP